MQSVYSTEKREMQVERKKNQRENYEEVRLKQGEKNCKGDNRERKGGKNQKQMINDVFNISVCVRPNKTEHKGIKWKIENKDFFREGRGIPTRD